MCSLESPDLFCATSSIAFCLKEMTGLLTQRNKNHQVYTYSSEEAHGLPRMCPRRPEDLFKSAHFSLAQPFSH
ncbi:hypothetical protein CYMTET_43679 [Cymbomonas tetramitiformis]|uniref:Uncharacterized protein n=1 Tax=Cymbomonas tetramitiformis TaxID=36881 RepID=A0AAE0C2Z4_9CHLO|nr:hypothetical protein CYMTET_43679 [Cymbomonas tetramitiformis]